MKRERVIISGKAQSSIKEIFEYLKEETSLETATKVKNTIIQKCKSLKDFAGYSKETFLDELEGEYWSVNQWNYIIIYSLTTKDVQILNVIHSSMHPDKRKNI